MRRYSERHGLQTISELNVTPLLDLAFVLLIIFMITTPLMENSVELVVPSSEASPKAPDPATVQNISINREELITLNGTPVALDQLENELLALKQQRPEIAVAIRSHKELPVQKLIDLMDVVQKAKINKIGVITNPEN
ncbi:MAG: exbD [Chthoniobacteraceae bacterium]|nr:exbD [Chthoniobacteraceae bacterium]MDB6174910.1 exbD [Chthoniobacteraceae bacterium]